MARLAGNGVALGKRRNAARASLRLCPKRSVNQKGNRIVKRFPRKTDRIVIPLGKRSAFGSEGMQGLTPEISFAEQELLLLIPQISAVSEKYLRHPVGSLSHFRDRIVGALDTAITGI